MTNQQRIEELQQKLREFPEDQLESIEYSEIATELNDLEFMNDHFQIVVIN